jgi:hypothetical protein
MGDKEINSLLTGIIILLLMFIVWKWVQKNSMYKNKDSCHTNYMNLQCGCRNGMCRCIRRVRNPTYGSGVRDGFSSAESMSDCARKNNQSLGTPGYQEKIVEHTGDFSGDMIQQLALDPEIIKSQNEYINGSGFSGLATGSSHDTTLEETGRSYGTADFVGLTQRKFCKARQLAKPAAGARFVPSETIKEWCDINMDELI